jgi:hypothetical protein
MHNRSVVDPDPHQVKIRIRINLQMTAKYTEYEPILALFQEFELSDWRIRKVTC